MQNITLKSGFLSVPTLSAGATHNVSCGASGIDDGAELYLILVDDETGLPIAVSELLNEGNAYAGKIDLYTDVVFSTFAQKPLTERRWINAEMIDVANKVSLGTSSAVLRNSALIAGSSIEVPEITTMLTTASFASINDAMPTTVNQVASLLAEILQKLQGK